MATRIITFFLVLLLSACGGGDPDELTQQPAQADKPAAITSLHVIGNSLTLHTPIEAIDWHGSWGMAASSADKDFAHVAAASLKVPLQVRGFSGIEYDFATYIPHIGDVTFEITPTTAVVVQLGDNVQVPTLAEFEPAYAMLLDAAKNGAMLLCLSTWWENPEKDVVIKRQCLAHGGRYVYIGDIYPTRKDAVGTFTNAGVDAHPHDWSMAVIGARVAAAVVSQQ